MSTGGAIRGGGGGGAAHTLTHLCARRSLRCTHPHTHPRITTCAQRTQVHSPAMLAAAGRLHAQPFARSAICTLALTRAPRLLALRPTPAQLACNRAAGLCHSSPPPCRGTPALHTHTHTHPLPTPTCKHSVMQIPAHTHTHTPVHAPTCTHTLVHTLPCAHPHAHTHTHTLTHVHKHSGAHSPAVHTHVHTPSRAHTPTLARLHTCSHPPTCTPTPVHTPMCANTPVHTPCTLTPPRAHSFAHSPPPPSPVLSL